MKILNTRFILKRNLILPLFALCFFAITSLSSCTKATPQTSVIYSDWFTPSTYVKDTTFGMYGFSYTKAVAELTAQTLDSSTVLVFGKLDGYTTAIWPTDQVGQLPITVTYMESSTVYNDVWSASETPGDLKIRFVDDHNLYNGISNAHQFRYVIIPGNTLAARPALGAAHSPNYAAMSYSQLCGSLNIPE